MNSARDQNIELKAPNSSGMAWRAWFGLAVMASVAACSQAVSRSSRAMGSTVEPVSTVSSGDSVDLGYGFQSRRSMIGAVQSVVFADDARRPQVNRIADLLEGRIAGVVVERSVDGTGSLRVRGVGATFSRSEPLLVVDGTPWPPNIPIRTLLMGVNPGDVVRIDVLKDASSSAIYGARAANGVVLITLRHSGR